LLNWSGLNLKSVKEVREVDAAQIDSVNVRIDNGKIELRRSDGNKNRVELTGKMRRPNDARLEIEEREGTLSIEFANGRQHRWFNLFSDNEDMKVTVLVPERLKGVLEAYAANGEVSITGVGANRLTATVRNGSIRLSRTEADETVFELINGDVSLERVSGDVNGEVLNGKIEADMERLEQNVDLSVLNGSIRVTTAHKPKDAVYDLRTTVGRVSVFGSQDWEPLTGDGTYKLKMRVTNGNITIDTAK